MIRIIPFLKGDPVVPVIRLQGMIASAPRAGVLSDAGLAPMIEKAFRRGKPAAIALVVNSPGGSPTQSSLIASRIRRLADEKKLKVYAFVEDLAASGGYWLASAADEIWVDQNSIVGSIGVISAGFGFDQFIGRYGVERRVYTAGERKGMLDPFQPEKSEDVVRLKEIQRRMHENFIGHVRTRREAKLGEGDLFNGDFWVGVQAVDLGLADGIGHVVPKMKEVFGEKVRLVPYQQRRPFFARFAAALAGEVIGSTEERAGFARYGI